MSDGSQTQDGLALARALHQIAPLRPVLLAAVAAIDISVDRLADAGISEVLPWPLASTELAAALARCLRTGGLLQS